MLPNLNILGTNADKQYYTFPAAEEQVKMHRKRRKNELVLGRAVRFQQDEYSFRLISSFYTIAQQELT